MERPPQALMATWRLLPKFFFCCAMDLLKKLKALFMRSFFKKLLDNCFAVVKPDRVKGFFFKFVTIL